MSSVRPLVCLGLLVCAAAPVSAQVVSESNREAGQASASRWRIGLAVASREGIYAGEDDRTLVFPNVSYEGERFFWRGAQAGLHLFSRGGFVLDGYVAGRLDGVDADDFGVTELAERGIDRRLLEDRDDAADVGMSARWRGAAGELELDARADVTSTSEGQQASITYRYPFRAGGWQLTPGVGVRWLSSDLADYYYGTLDEEIARGVVRYRPGSVTVPTASLILMRPFAEKWLFIASAEYRRLPSALRDSPLVERDTDGGATVMVGFSRGF
jgi:outer membrane protein